jgi:Zn-dependent protease with chaperone function
MHYLTNWYPATPQNVPPGITQPSAAFKKEAKQVLGAIWLFFAVYLLLIAAALLLAAACVYLGLMLMVYFTHLLTILAGLGIISIGIMVFIFLVKFIFTVKQFDESGSMAVTEAEQPQLYAFIKQLTADTQTPFPKKLVLSPEVNACVYYNDSFWSMFFPVKKNLQIGLGLVNTLTISEFKAVMAHEFGHFSQRSMKLGSFVYNVNKVIYNMLFDNKGFGSFLDKWGSVHYTVGIFVHITVYILQGIQKVLQAVYRLVNKKYMALSREMEFHADAVAASVSGSNNCISALQKIEVGELCYQTVIQKANEQLKSKQAMENVYDNHNEVMRRYAQHNNLPLQNHTPLADAAFFKKFAINKVNVKDQWASHPPREEREQHLQMLNVVAETDSRPAWLLFSDAAALQLKASALLYKTVPDAASFAKMDGAAFEAQYGFEIEKYTLPPAYNGFYDNRSMNDMDFEAVMERPCNTPVNQEQFNRLFADEWIILAKSLAANEHDAMVLKAIADKQIDAESFDYDGQKMHRAEAAAMAEKVNETIAAQRQQLQQHEEDIVAFFYKAAQQIGPDRAAGLKEKYLAHFGHRRNTEAFMQKGQKAMDILAPLFGGAKMEPVAAAMLADNLRHEAQDLRPLIATWAGSGTYDSDPELKELAVRFAERDYRYYHNGSFFEGEIQVLYRLINETLSLRGEFQFMSFKQLLAYQLQVYKEASPL